MQDDASSATMESRSINVNKKKIPYPKSVFAVILNEFCERFSYLGLRAILSIYLVEQLFYSENEATVIFHSFHFVAFGFPLFGSIIADSWLGKFKTIFYFSLVYVCGSILVTLASIPPLSLPNVVTVAGLFVIAIGTGGIKTSAMPFGAEQFVLPQQQGQLAAFYSMYYFFITFGGLLSAGVTPLLRRHLVCFGKDSCYPAAFGVPAVFMLMSVVVFYFARRWYRMLPYEDNLIVRMGKCMGYAIKMKVKLKGTNKNHWLDYSEEKYGERLVEDIKVILRVFFMFLPVPLYWALIEQTATAWVFMARRMNGDLGFYTLSPDQMSLIGSIIYISLIPIVQFVVIPRFERRGILRRPLKKMIIGGFFLVVSFLMAAGVSFAVENTNELVMNSAEGHLRVYNTLPCDVSISYNSTVVSLTKGGYYKNTALLSKGNQSLSFQLQSSCANISGNFLLLEEKVSSYFFKENKTVFLFHDGEKEELGLPLVRTLLNPNAYQTSFTINYKSSNTNTEINASNTSLHSFSAGLYTIEIGDSKYQQKFSLGGVYTVLAIPFNQTNFDVSVVEVTPPHSVHMMWIIPPGFILDIGIILFAVPGLEFAYSQAPASMKTVIMAGWLLTTAIGNLIIVIIQTIDPLEKSSYNFLLYSALMLMDVAMFGAMSTRYNYVNREEVTTTTLDNSE